MTKAPTAKVGRAGRIRAGLVSVAALSAALLVLPATAPPAGAALLGSSTSPYIVADVNGVDATLATSDVASVGGQVVEALGAANAVLAQLTPIEVSLLDAVPGVVLTPDVTVAVQGGVSTGPHAPSAVFPEQTGATSLWQQGDSGQGVNVAVLDTGIDPLPDFAGRLVGGVDLTGEGNPYQDDYGHGTFVAGLIAGDGASSNGRYMGEAPGAGLVAVKVAGATGETDLATVIAGVGWTIANHLALNIGVLNMSLGYQPMSSTAVDPLDTAVEKAWDAGIVVVVSAGNAGPFNGTILSPGDDPMVITVGALDDRGQPNVSHDTMTNFSSVGPTSPDGWFKPDLVTSGRSVVSLAAPGSTVYDDYPSARVGSGNFVGSGTSFSSAITSGAVALYLSAYPASAPDAVKSTLLASTNPGPVGNPLVDGHGALDVAAAVAMTPVGLAQQALQSGTTLAAESAAAMGSTVSLATTWGASSWNPGNWTSVAWNSVAWNGSTWSGVSPDSVAWNGSVWNSVAWNGDAWNSVAWNGAEWNSVAWNGSSWNSVAWNGSSWNGAAWNSVAWNGSQWS